MVTVREIAARAGVSLGTVDRVLHDRGRVSPSTAARVRAAVDELGFTPNVFARNLSVSREYRLGALMPELSQDEGYWRAPLAGMERAAESLRGYGFSFRASFFDRYDPDSFRSAFERLLADGVDGILMAPVQERAALSALDRLQASEGARPPAIACFDTGIRHPSIRFRIGQDSFRGGRLAARLMSLCRRGEGPIAVIKPDADNAHIADRVEGFRAAMSDSGIGVDVATRPSRADTDAMEEFLSRLLGNGPAYSGILVADSTASPVARALSALDRPGPPVMGFDLLETDIPFLESGGISFLIAQSPAEQGETGVRKLFEVLVHGTEVEGDIPIPLTVICRENYVEYLGKA